VIALIDYGAGNLTSVRKALAYLGAKVTTPETPEMLLSADAVIVPGVGNFEATSALGSDWHRGISATVEKGNPLLGICLGLQWLFQGSDEAPKVSGYGAIKGQCRLIDCAADELSTTKLFKVPHVGWNSLHKTRESWLLHGVTEGDQVYFTHSYAAPVTNDCIGLTHYGIDFASVVERDNLVGVQFHPEKSGSVGLRILKNFIDRTRH